MGFGMIHKRAHTFEATKEASREKTVEGTGQILTDAKEGEDTQGKAKEDLRKLIK